MTRKLDIEEVDFVAMALEEQGEEPGFDAVLGPQSADLETHSLTAPSPLPQLMEAQLENGEVIARGDEAEVREKATQYQLDHGRCRICIAPIGTIRPPRDLPGEVRGTPPVPGK